MTRDDTHDAAGTAAPSDGVAAVAARIGAAAAFWVAVALPVALVALLAGGIERPTDVATFLLLVGVNGTALLAGHGYADHESQR
ncbi:hypothetical protein BRD00_14020 [Halobacteriales archaeon QS_8_69_26]|nr:MAG: hypothetical protein BRD00_14020 [Halobacteriales archaeon QS_8_69_26]